MKTKAHFCLIILLIISACATAQVYQKPGIDFTKFKKIAIVKFNCSSDPTIGQEVADNIALEFLKKGYDVIERSQLESIINEEKLRQYGLTDSARFKLHTSGINAIVVGSVTSYRCIPRKAPIIYMGRLYGVVDTNSCTGTVKFFV